VEQGVFERMWELGLEQYAEEIGIDWEWMAMDGNGWSDGEGSIGGKKQRVPILQTEGSLAPNGVC
jgi:hypothetical protein